MKISRINAKDYSIIIGKNSIFTLRSEIKNHCPKCKKIAIIIDKKNVIIGKTTLDISEDILKIVDKKIGQIELD